MVLAFIYIRDNGYESNYLSLPLSLYLFSFLIVWEEKKIDSTDFLYKWARLRTILYCGDIFKITFSVKILYIKLGSVNMSPFSV